MTKNIKRILNEYVKGLNKIIGNHLKQVILYGSYARGEQDKNGVISDIDILILVDLDINEIKKLEKKIIESIQTGKITYENLYFIISFKDDIHSF